MSKGIRIDVAHNPGDSERTRRLLTQAAALVEDLSQTYNPADTIMILSMALGCVRQAQLDSAAALPVFLGCVGAVVELVQGKTVRGG